MDLPLLCDKNSNLPATFSPILSRSAYNFHFSRSPEIHSFFRLPSTLSLSKKSRLPPQEQSPMKNCGWHPAPPRWSSSPRRSRLSVAPKTLSCVIFCPEPPLGVSFQERRCWNMTHPFFYPSPIPHLLFFFSRFIFVFHLGRLVECPSDPKHSSLHLAPPPRILRHERTRCAPLEDYRVAFPHPIPRPLLDRGFLASTLRGSIASAERSLLMVNFRLFRPRSTIFRVLRMAESVTGRLFVFIRAQYVRRSVRPAC